MGDVKIHSTHYPGLSKTTYFFILFGTVFFFIGIGLWGTGSEEGDRTKEVSGIVIMGFSLILLIVGAVHYIYLRVKFRKRLKKLIGVANKIVIREEDFDESTESTYSNENTNHEESAETGAWDFYTGPLSPFLMVSVLFGWGHLDLR